MAKNALNVRLDLKKSMVRGSARITLPPGEGAAVDLSGLRVLSATLNGMPVIVDPVMPGLTLHASSSEDTVVIEYEAEFAPGSGGGNLVNEDAVSLSSGWYPVLGSPAVHELSVTLPEGYEAVSEADGVSVSGKAGGYLEFHFSFPHPIPAVSLLAGRYVTEKTRYGDVDIVSYFFPEDAGLSKTYLEYAGKFIGLYEGLLGKYPFKRFAIVEGPLSAGSARPTYALFGRDIARLPFIAETSLGHEVVHQWFGSLVYPGPGGNWTEGLATYIGDHLYEERKGKGWDYRRQMLISFQSYVNAENDFSLKEFSSGVDGRARAIGYGKAAMVFHMLKRLIGEEAFFSSLRRLVREFRFAPASWDDIRRLCESAYGRDLGWFFDQWVGRDEGPELAVRDLNLSYAGSKAFVSFKLKQNGKAFRFALPVTVKTEDGETRKEIEIGKEETDVEVETGGFPTELILDDRYDIFRRLEAEEFPPVVSRLFGDGKRIFVIPRDREKAYEELAKALIKEGFVGKKEEEIGYEELRQSSLLIPETETALAGRLFGKREKSDYDFYLEIRENPFNRRGVIALVQGTPAEMGGYLRRAVHYGKYGRVAFMGGKNVLKEKDERGGGMVAKVSEPVPAVEVPRITDLRLIAERAAQSGIVYVGEVHDRFEQHRIQYEVIRRLHERSGKIAIGMEMFQKPFQKFLDDYISGSIDEKEFLKKTEYFKRWGFDYKLYREILLYAREHRIPVIALNIRKEIVSRVSKAGIFGLSEEERKELPEYVDLGDGSYRERLREFFGRHRASDERNFDFFYQAQVLWDEAMAQNLNEFVERNPDRQVVVLAGYGHLFFGAGIPQRSYRLNKKGYTVILSGDDVREDIADFVLFPEPVKFVETPRLMVQLKDVDGQVRVQDFPPESISEKAGLRKDDIILSIDGAKIETSDDLRIFLLYKKKGDEVAVRVSRDRFLWGPGELTIKVTL